MRCYKHGIIGKRTQVGIMSNTDIVLITEGKKFFCTSCSAVAIYSVL